jgi:hypothetical protein
MTGRRRSGENAGLRFRGGSRGSERFNLLRRRKSDGITRMRPLEDPALNVYTELTAMGTCVRDRSGLGLHGASAELSTAGTSPKLSAASELQFVSLAEALELTLLLAGGDLEKYNRAALR